MVVFRSDRRFGSFEQFVSRRFKYCSAPGRNCVMTWSLTAHRGLLHPLKLYLVHIAVIRCLTFNTFLRVLLPICFLWMWIVVIQSMLLFVTFLLIVKAIDVTYPTLDSQIFSWLQMFSSAQVFGLEVFPRRFTVKLGIIFAYYYFLTVKVV